LLREKPSKAGRFAPCRLPAATGLQEIQNPPEREFYSALNLWRN
jgi:hypothetical protein